MEVVMKHITQIVVGIVTAGIIGLTIASFNMSKEVTLLTHNMEDLENKLDKSEFYNYKENDYNEDVLMLQLLKQEIKYIDAKLDRIGDGH